MLRLVLSVAVLTASCPVVAGPAVTTRDFTRFGLDLRTIATFDRVESVDERRLDAIYEMVQRLGDVITAESLYREATLRALAAGLPAQVLAWWTSHYDGVVARWARTRPGLRRGLAELARPFAERPAAERLGILAARATKGAAVLSIKTTAFLLINVLAAGIHMAITGGTRYFGGVQWPFEPDPDTRAEDLAAARAVTAFKAALIELSSTTCNVDLGA